MLFGFFDGQVFIINKINKFWHSFINWVIKRSLDDQKSSVIKNLLLYILVIHEIKIDVKIIIFCRPLKDYGLISWKCRFRACFGCTCFHTCHEATCAPPLTSLTLSVSSPRSPPKSLLFFRTLVAPLLFQSKFYAALHFLSSFCCLSSSNHSIISNIFSVF